MWRRSSSGGMLRRGETLQTCPLKLIVEELLISTSSHTQIANTNTEYRHKTMTRKKCENRNKDVGKVNVAQLLIIPTPTELHAGIADPRIK